jgi:hypothetical protein
VVVLATVSGLAEFASEVMDEENFGSLGRVLNRVASMEEEDCHRDIGDALIGACCHIQMGTRRFQDVVDEISSDITSAVRDLVGSTRKYIGRHDRFGELLSLLAAINEKHLVDVRAANHGCDTYRICVVLTCCPSFRWFVPCRMHKKIR